MVMREVFGNGIINFMYNLKRMSIMKIKIYFVVLITIITTMPIMAQELTLSDTIFTNKKPKTFFDNFKKNIAIDKENYDIYIDYDDSEKGIIIFSGKAKNVGSLMANFRDVLVGEIKFKIQLKYHQSSGNFTFSPQEIIFTYNSGPRRDFSYMPSSILKELRNELNTVIIYGPDFEINNYFITTLRGCKIQMEDRLTKSENIKLKKKERKKAKKEYDEYAIKYKVYNDVYSEVEGCLAKLKLYYLYD